MSRAKRLWAPSLIFLLFLSITFFSQDLLLQFGSKAIGQSQEVLRYVILIGIWLSAAFFLNRVIVVFVWEGLIEKALGGPVPRLLKDVMSVIIYVIAITGIVGIVFQKSVSGFWTASGVAGLVLGLALKNIILDIFTGLSVNIERPFKIGDWIRVHGGRPDQDIVGKITEINWRTTRLESEVKNVVILPNRLLGTSVVTNFYAPGLESRQETSFWLDFSIPRERAMRVLLAGAKSVLGQKGLLEKPAPSVIVNQVTDMGVEYKVRYWFTPWVDMAPGMARSTISKSILNHLKQAGMMPAYPRQDILYAGAPDRTLDLKSMDDRTRLLAGIEMFEYLETEELNELASRMRLQQFNEGDELIKQGDAGESMFILSEGVLHAFINSNNGKDRVRVGKIEPGEFFGEMSLLTGEPRTATIVASTDVVAHEITKDHINTLLARRPEIAETISKVVAHRKLVNTQALANASPEEKIEQTENLAQQIMTKMKSFFKGVFEKR
ncbi:MAG: mechanosensitive ion channel family protein [bacterium]